MNGLRLSTWLSRVSRSRCAVRRRPATLCGVPFLFGLYSVWLGSDVNWDFYNYHLYNPFALLEDKQRIDIAAAGFQSWFNPLLDLPGFLLAQVAPSRLFGFLVGVLHGTAFLLVVAIAGPLLPTAYAKDRQTFSFVAAGAGCLTTGYLLGFATSTGDVTTALLVLGSLALIVRRWDRIAPVNLKSVALMGVGGLMVGVAVGLKPTNVIFAVGMCLASFALPARWSVRCGLAIAFGVGVLVGAALSGGWWAFHLWTAYGNPIFPQFGRLFPHPWSTPDGVADARWLPRNWTERLLWPFIFTLNPRRVGEHDTHQIIWPIVYILMATSTCLHGWRTARRWQVSKSQHTLPGSSGAGFARDPLLPFLLIFFAGSFITWLFLFSVYRYLVAIELIAPLVAMVLLGELLPANRVRGVAIVLIGSASLVVFLDPQRSLGRAGWSDPLVTVEVPALTDPARTSVLLFSRANAWAWIATQFPPSVAFGQLGGNFPGTPEFRAQFQKRARERGGPVFFVIDGTWDSRSASIDRANRLATALKLSTTKGGCAALQWIVVHTRYKADLVDNKDRIPHCRFELRTGDRRPIEAENAALVAEASETAVHYGFELDRASCASYRAAVGDSVHPYQWCSAMVGTDLRSR